MALEAGIRASMQWTLAWVEEGFLSSLPLDGDREPQPGPAQNGNSLGNICNMSSRALAHSRFLLGPKPPIQILWPSPVFKDGSSHFPCSASAIGAGG
jgi:hypothetical protein